MSHFLLFDGFREGLLHTLIGYGPEAVPDLRFYKGDSNILPRIFQNLWNGRSDPNTPSFGGKEALDVGSLCPHALAPRYIIREVTNHVFV